MLLVKHPRCPFCHEEIVATDPKRACESCMGWHHRECWSESGERCAACGEQNQDAPPPPAMDLSVHVEGGPLPESPIRRPACCAAAPCPKHAILSSVLQTLSEASLRTVAKRSRLVLAPSCTAVLAVELLRGVEIELPVALAALSRAELGEATRRLGLQAQSATRRHQQARLLSRSQLIRAIHALPGPPLRTAAAALAIRLSDPRRVGTIRRDLLLQPDLTFADLLGVLRRDDLARVCRTLGLHRSGTKARLKARLRASAQAP